jgi:hypothetical protein
MVLYKILKLHSIRQAREVRLCESDRRGALRLGLLLVFSRSADW